MTSGASTIRRDVVVIAASAGGIPPLQTILRTLPEHFPAAVAIVQHRTPVARGRLVEVLRRSSRMPLFEPRDGERFEPGLVFLAPRDRHLLLVGSVVHLSRGPKQHHLRPAADPLFESAAVAFGTRVVGVVLSGGGDDAARGCLAISACGGVLLVQSPEEAAVPYMPLCAMKRDGAHRCMPVERLATTIVDLVTEGTSRP